MGGGSGRGQKTWPQREVHAQKECALDLIYFSDKFATWVDVFVLRFYVLSILRVESACFRELSHE